MLFISNMKLENQSLTDGETSAAKKPSNRDRLNRLGLLKGKCERYFYCLCPKAYRELSLSAWMFAPAEWIYRAVEWSRQELDLTRGEDLSGMTHQERGKEIKGVASKFKL